MSWNNLKAGIAAIVRANGNQEITGTNLQSVLNAMVNGLGQNATFAGVAIPSTDPGVPDGPVFYLAGRHGRYSNFGNVRFDTSNAIAIFVWDGSTWSKTELEFTVEGGGGGGGGGGTDIDPNIATFTSSKVTIKVPLDVWDEATFTKIFVGDDNLDVEDNLVQLLTKTRDISVSTSATTGEDIVDIETDVLIEGDLEILDDVIIRKTVTINDGDGEVFIESGGISANGIEADSISAGTILLNRVNLGTTLAALNTKTAGISRTVNSNVGTTTIGEDLVISGGLMLSGGTTIGGNVNCSDIFCGNVEADAYFTSDGLNIVSEIGTIKSAVAVQANWSENDNTSRAYIRNKPTIGTAAALNAPVSGNASSSEVVKGNDTRLTDARPASDVYPWAKEAAPPVVTKAGIGLGNVDNTSDLNKPVSTATQNALNGKQDVLPIESSSAGATLDCVADKYYVLTSAIGTFTITLPTMTDATKAHTIGLYLTTGATPALTIAGTNLIKYDAAWFIAANTTYEVNALWNGVAWVLTLIEIQ